VKHVILGNGPAGVVAAEDAAQGRSGDAITLVGDEPGPPYSRMAIPYLLMGNIEETGRGCARIPAISPRLGIALKEARAASGRRRGASGEARVRRDSSLRSAARGERLAPEPPADSRARPSGRASMLDPRRRARDREAREEGQPCRSRWARGLSAASSWKRSPSAGVDLVVVEMGERMVPRMMPQGASDLIRAWCERRGVRVVTGTRVKEIRSVGGRLDISLSDGQLVAADLVISATASRPILRSSKAAAWLATRACSSTSACRRMSRVSTPPATLHARRNSTPET
jgi:phytoene dehydrogenase-like protein